MAYSTDYMKQWFEGIRDERRLQANTATRVGTAFLMLLRYLLDPDTPFLRKDREDMTSFLLRLLAGVEVGEYAAGRSGAAIGTDGAGELLSLVLRTWLRSHGIENTGNIENTGDINNLGDIVTKNLRVLGSAHFTELIIDVLRHVGGQIVLSAARCKADRVVKVTDSGGGDRQWHVYWRAEQDGTQTGNPWMAGDQALCMSFQNAREGVSHDVGNHYWWLRVLRAGTQQLEDEDGETKAFHYIVLTKEGVRSEDSEPTAGDDIVLFGSSNTDRQSAVVLSAYATVLDQYEYTEGYYGPQPPYLVQYNGITGWGLNAEGRMSNTVTLLSPLRNIIKGDFLTYSGTDLHDLVDGIRNDVVSIRDHEGEDIQIWFGEGAPVLTEGVFPVSEWGTPLSDELCAEHEGDIYCNTSDDFGGDETAGRYWRLTALEEGTNEYEDADRAGLPHYVWTPIRDKMAEDALSYVRGAGFVTSEDMARMYAVRWDAANGRLVSASITAQTLDGATDISSLLRLAADQIQLEGYTSINGHFTVDEQGNARMEDAQMKNAQVDGVLSLGTTFIDASAQDGSDYGRTLFVDFQTVRSVTVRTINDVGTGRPSMVVLPMYDACEMDTENRTAQYRQAGTLLTIRNAWSPWMQNWRNASDIISAQTSTAARTAMKAELYRCALFVVADPRIVSATNIISDTEVTVSPNHYQHADGSYYADGCMYCHGYRARIAMLLPGQELRLRSSVETDGSGTPFLAWYVENADEFTAVKKDVHFSYKDVSDRNLTASLLFEFRSGKEDLVWGYSPGDTHQRDVFLAPTQADADTGDCEDPYIEVMASATDDERSLPYIMI